jgi:hypothetical protein
MIRTICLLATAASLFAADNNLKLTYTKQFPGSRPEYVGITLDPAGAGEYREAVDDESPLKFQLSPAEAAEIFALVDKLDRFKRPLESGLKVANMGKKTFRLEDGAQKTEQVFNYTQDPDGRALYEWFEKITESELDLVNLQRVIRFDRLGLNQAMLQLQSSYDRKRLVGAEQFLPLLDRVAKNETFMHMTRERAASLADAIRAVKPKTE